MIVPSGKRKQQVSQGGDKYASILDDSLFKEAIGTPTFEPPTADPGMAGLFDKPQRGEQNPTPGERDPNADIDLGLAGDNPRSIAPNGTPHQPIKAQPSGVVPEEEVEASEQPDFWSQLANAISPFLEKRNLRIMGNPKLTDRQNSVYELLLGPKLDPRTGQPMQLPDANVAQLYADANEIANSAKGRIHGLPYIDEKQIWHIPLQIGGAGGQKAVSKSKNR
jgi:hypothetical protein